jgi:hypothetical protein
LVVPEYIVGNIEEHDSQYMSILDQIFEMALKTNEESVPDSPFAFPMLRWLKPIRT